MLIFKTRRDDMRMIKLAVLILLTSLTAFGHAASTPVPAEPESNKGSKADCQPATEAKKYQSLVGKNIMAKMLWKKPSASQETLQFPFTVTAITDDGLAVSIREFSLKAHYVPLLYNSGHLLVRNGVTVLDICAAQVSLEDEDKPYIEFHR
jgi:hypothetical protein